MPLTLRPAIEADRDAIFALGVAEEAAWFGEPEVDAKEVGEWVDEEGGVGPGVVAVDDEGAVRGFASPGRVDSLFLADPALTDALADLLLPWLLERRDHAELLVFAGDTARVAAFERHRLRHQHSSFTLARPEEAGPLPRVPTDHLIRPYALGDDDERVHHLVYRDAAWASVPGHRERSLEQWRDAMGSSPVRFVAYSDDRPVGFVAGRLMVTGRGWVDQLAVAADERRQGLGRFLLVHAFRHLEDVERAKGLALGVQAANEGALGLYRSIGFEIEREWRIYAVSTSG